MAQARSLKEAFKWGVWIGLTLTISVWVAVGTFQVAGWLFAGPMDWVMSREETGPTVNNCEKGTGDISDCPRPKPYSKVRK